MPGLVVVRNYHTNHYCCLLIRTSSIKECRFFHNLLLFVTEEFHLRRALKPRSFKFLLQHWCKSLQQYDKISLFHTCFNQLHHSFELSTSLLSQNWSKSQSYWHKLVRRCYRRNLNGLGFRAFGHTFSDASTLFFRQI